MQPRNLDSDTDQYDRMRGGGGDDYLNGGGGDDILDGRGGVDLCDGGSDVNGDTGRSCETTLNIP